MFIAAIVGLFSACKSNGSSDQTLPEGVHSVIVNEVLQTSQYTYLHVKDGNSEPWLAVTKMDANVGETYYFKDGLPMKDFQSKELNRTFSEVLFLDNISKDPNLTFNAVPPASVALANGSMDAAEMNQGANSNATATSSDAHKVVAKEVLQTSQYTYILGKEGDADHWLAAKKMDAKVGETYYFTGGLPMTKFESKELKRTFDEVFFLDNISTTPVAANAQEAPVVSSGSAIPLEKKEVTVKKDKGEISIASLFENKKTYSGKTIKIKGQVSKFSAGIMKKNWIHLQDGTDFSGKFDLTITTDQVVKVGDNITLEGKITLDKDFGFGYFYDVIMEEAKLIK
ncbi:MAG: hypothetical protein A3F72_05435 [Bacteroidetes bacterium RIFCSPLOWO2_12_FULL_35_15]|nr:MAG: hypothetical protein A3F72_05435 [Bacteroidetes bacterium RIFCSPLOWO2_12_FULL_35_15]